VRTLRCANARSVDCLRLANALARPLAPNRLLGVLGLALLGAPGCSTVQQECPRTWVAIGAGTFDQHRTSNDVEHDSLGLSLDGGYDLNTELVRASVEMGLGWSEHDVSGDTPAHDVTRVNAGVRLTAYADRTPIDAYVRGGWFWRDDDQHDGVVFIDDEWGNYLGCGIEFRCGFGAIGPFVTYMRNSDGDFEETYFGAAARFYVD
jgi:hypothetical protein